VVLLRIQVIWVVMLCRWAFPYVLMEERSSFLTPEDVVKMFFRNVGKHRAIQHNTPVDPNAYFRSFTKKTVIIKQMYKTKNMIRIRDFVSWALKLLIGSVLSFARNH